MDEILIIIPAMLAGCIVLLTHLPLGRLVLQRGIIFIDLAIAQIAGLGVIAANSLLETETGWLAQLFAYCSALLGAMVLHSFEKRWPEVQEATIGSVFVLAATGSILLLASDPHGGEQLQDLLAGQILWVTYDQLWLPLLISLGLLLVLYLRREATSNFLFYLVFAVAITTSVQLVGVYLVFASLIIPALFSRHIQDNSLIFAGLIGLAGYATGLIISAYFDLPASPLIVWGLALFGSLFGLLTRNHKSKA